MGNGDAAGRVVRTSMQQPAQRVVRNLQRPQPVAPLGHAFIDATDNDVVYGDAVLRIRRALRLKGDAFPRLEEGPDGDRRLAVDSNALQCGAGRGEYPADPGEGPLPPGERSAKAECL